MSSLFGSRPNYAQVQSPYQEIAGVYKGLPQLTAGAGNYTGQLLSGVLPSDVSEGIKNQSAAWGLESGAGNAQGDNSLTGNFSLKDLGLTSLQEQQQGFGDYLNFLTGVGSQQLSPEIQMQIAQGEAQPNPNATGYMKLGTSVLGAIL